MVNEKKNSCVIYKKTMVKKLYYNNKNGCFKLCKDKLKYKLIIYANNGCKGYSSTYTDFVTEGEIGKAYQNNEIFSTIEGVKVIKNKWYVKWNFYPDWQYYAEVSTDCKKFPDPNEFTYKTIIL